MPTSGGETKQDPSGWTTDTLRAHLEQRFSDVYRSLDERDKRYEQRFQAQQEALNEKKETTDARLDLLNESRNTIDDLLNRAMPRTEAEARLLAIEKYQERQVGSSAGLDKGWGYLVGFTGMVAAVVALIL